MKKVVMITGLLISFFMMRSIEAMLPHHYDEQEVILGNIDAAEFLQRIAQSNFVTGDRLNFIIKNDPHTYDLLVTAVQEYVMEAKASVTSAEDLNALALQLAGSIRTLINKQFSYVFSQKYLRENKGRYEDSEDEESD